MIQAFEGIGILCLGVFGVAMSVGLALLIVGKLMDWMDL